MNLKAIRDMSKRLTSNTILMSHIRVHDRDIILMDLNKGVNMSTALLKSERVFPFELNTKLMTG